MRRPPRSTEERLVRAHKSMMPGTLGGRVASAAPMSLDVSRLDPRLRAQKRPGSTGAGFDPNADPVVIGLDADGGGGVHSVVIGQWAFNEDGNSYVTAVGWGATGKSQGATALGQDCLAAGQGGTAVGSDAIARGQYDVCIGAGGATGHTPTTGQRNIAIGHFAVTQFAYPYSNASDCIAIGSYAEADADGSIAIGNGAWAPNLSAVAIGNNASTQDDYSVAIGDNAYANAQRAVTLGKASRVYGNDAVGIGTNCFADGTSSIAIGLNTTAGNEASVAIGTGATATIDHQIVLGTSAEFVEIPGAGIVFHDSGGGRWRLTVDTSGAPVWAAA